MKDIVKPTVVLLLICSFVTLALAFTNSMTKDRIAEAAKIEEDNAKKKYCLWPKLLKKLKMLRQ